jgi:hypothetical protein
MQLRNKQSTQHAHLHIFVATGPLTSRLIHEIPRQDCRVILVSDVGVCIDPVDDDAGISVEELDGLRVREEIITFICRCCPVGICTPTKPKPFTHPLPFTSPALSQHSEVHFVYKSVPMFFTLKISQLCLSHIPHLHIRTWAQIQSPGRNSHHPHLTIHASCLLETTYDSTRAHP